MTVLNPSLDKIDARILRALQADGRVSNLKLAETVHLSATAVLERVKRLTRDGFITATKGLGTWDAAGLGCQPVDVSAAGFGKQPETACSWYVQIKDGKFVLYPNKNPIKGKLIPESISG
jgi:hypothetical protein